MRYSIERRVLHREQADYAIEECRYQIAKALIDKIEPGVLHTIVITETLPTDTDFDRYEYQISRNVLAWEPTIRMVADLEKIGV